MKHKTNKIAAIFIATIFALSGLGIVYAAWTDTITIDGTVDTGYLELIIVPGSPSDTDNGIDPGYDKDVADTTIVIDPTDPHRAILTVTNAYPCYGVFWHMTVRNIGTIPVKLQDIIVTNPGDPCITVQAWDGMGSQLDPMSWGGPVNSYQEDVSGYIHIEQCANQGATYTFVIEFVFIQWNYYTP